MTPESKKPVTYFESKSFDSLCMNGFSWAYNIYLQARKEPVAAQNGPTIIDEETSQKKLSERGGQGVRRCLATSIITPAMHAALDSTTP